jgi:hypothetical protein
LEDNITFKRIALTPEQIIQYGLHSNHDLENPNSKAHKKINDGPRKNSFIDKYGIFTQYEVNALNSYVRDEFKDLVLSAVDNYFDEDIYNKVVAQKKYSLERLDKLLRKKIKK